MARHLIEDIAVDEQETPTVGQFVHQFVDHFDVAENDAAIIAQRLVVIAGDEDDALAVTGPAQQLLDDRVLGLRPVDAAAHGPEIDDVADQESLLGGIFTQEIEQLIGLAGSGTEVDVRQENGSNLGHAPTIARPNESLMTAQRRFDDRKP